jgi:hypothetical protein
MFKDGFMIKSKVVGHLLQLMILFKVLTKKLVKDGASQFQNFRLNFHNFHSLLYMRVSWLG